MYAHIARTRGAWD